MKINSYFSDKCSDVYKYVDRYEEEYSDNSRLVTYTGESFDEFKDCPFTQLGLMIQRDIFLAQKEGLMPEVGCKVRVRKDDINQINVNVEIYRSSEPLFKKLTKNLNELGVIVDLRIKQIVWKYNQQEVEVLNNQITRDLSYLELKITHSVKVAKDNLSTGPSFEALSDLVNGKLLEAV